MRSKESHELADELCVFNVLYNSKTCLAIQRSNTHRVAEVIDVLPHREGAEIAKKLHDNVTTLVGEYSNDMASHIADYTTASWYDKLHRDGVMFIGAYIEASAFCMHRPIDLELLRSYIHKRNSEILLKQKLQKEV